MTESEIADRAETAWRLILREARDYHHGSLEDYARQIIANAIRDAERAHNQRLAALTAVAGAAKKYLDAERTGRNTPFKRMRLKAALAALAALDKGAGSDG